MGWMKEDNYLHVWRIPRQAWYVKLYLAVWDADPQAVTFCKLWWGFVLMPIGLFVKALSYPAVGMVSALSDRPSREVKPPVIYVSQRPAVGRGTRFAVERGKSYENHYWTVYTKTREQYETFTTYQHTSGSVQFEEAGEHLVKVHAWGKDGKRHLLERTVCVYEKPALRIRFLEGVAYLAAKGIARARGGCGILGRVVSFPFRTVRRAVISFAVGWSAIVGAFVLSLLRAGGFPSTAAVWKTVSPTLRYSGIIVGGGIAVVACMFVCGGLIALLIESEAPSAVGRGIKRGLFLPVGHGVKRGGLTFRDVMKIGYVSVKSNTCPRVVIEEDPEESLLESDPQ